LEKSSINSYLNQPNVEQYLTRALWKWLY